jgi:predicted P-loop ATPase
MTKPISHYAARLVERFGMHIIPIQHHSKLPVQNDWGNNCLTTADDAREYFDAHPNQNVGLALGPSGFCSLDIDCAESFGEICHNYGIDLAELIANTPTIRGASKGCRLMFRVPDGANLPYQKLNWKRQDDQSKSFTVFELRSATDDKQRYDVLPPSIHPDTLQPYVWLTQPRDDWPEPPRWMLAMWADFATFKPQLQAMCPWAVVTPAHAVQARQQLPATSGASVIDSYCDAHPLDAELARYGYKQIGKRYLSPHSGTGLPGVLIFPDGRSAWNNHASDPLCSEDSGKPINSFDLFCYYDHNGDTSKAVKHAAEILGMKPTPRARIVSAPAPSVSVPATTASTDATTNERLDRGSYNMAEPLPFCTDKGKPVQHAENLREVARRIGVTIRYNVIRKEDEILCPGQSFSMDNEANASLSWLRSECSLFDLNTGPLKEFVTLLADQNLYNPVAEWILSKPWDKTSRLQAWCDTITGQDDHIESKRELKETLMRKWAISAVAAGMSPNGISAPGVLTIQGGQYIGKTKWFKSLVPDELNLVKDGLILRPEDKDSVKQACSFWMVELGELDATFRKADVAALKAFLTNSSDVLRRPYAAKDSQYARRTVFFASVNPSKFLNDPTGNRRYWTIEAVAIDHTHSIDMQQLWAEIYVMHKAGAGYYLTQEEVEQLNEHNEDFTTIDPIEERIQSGLRWDDPQSTWSWITATDALMLVGMDRPSRHDATTASALIRAMNGGQQKRTTKGRLMLAPQRMTH